MRAGGAGGADHRGGGDSQPAGVQEGIRLRHDQPVHGAGEEGLGGGHRGRDRQERALEGGRPEEGGRHVLGDFRKTELWEEREPGGRRPRDSSQEVEEHPGRNGEPLEAGPAVLHLGCRQEGGGGAGGGQEEGFTGVNMLQGCQDCLS